MMVHWPSYLYIYPSWTDILAYYTDRITDVTGCLVGYDVEHGKAYRILLKGMNKVVRVPNQKVVFDESYSLKSATKETHQDKGNVKIVDKPELMEHEVELDEVIINEEATGEEHPEELGPGSEDPNLMRLETME
jgi:hypothetical protein